MLATLSGCGGGASSSGSSEGAASYTLPSTTLYKEVPALEITGGGFTSSDVLFFNSKAIRTAEFYDSNQNGAPDKPINDFKSIVNATNRMHDENIAACLAKHDSPEVWDPSVLPDTMPASALNGTQYIQIAFPFPLDPESIFDTNPLNVGRDYLRGSVIIINDKNEHVNGTVLLDGRNAFGVGGYVLPPEIEISNSVLVFIAQSQVDLLTLPAVPTTFNSTVVAPSDWRAEVNEIRIRIGAVSDTSGKSVEVNANYYVAKTGFNPLLVQPNLAPSDIVATNILAIDKDIDPLTGLPYAAPNNQIVSRDTSFMLTFNKPVVPETVARSLTFDNPPFSGNTKVTENEYLYIWPTPDPCVQSPPVPPTPLGTNVSVIVTYVDDTGPGSTSAVIPFRCHPLHQNNLATYVIDPLIDLPGSTPKDLSPKTIKVRVEVSIYPEFQNAASGDPDDAGTIWSPVNLGPCSYFAEKFTGGGSGVISRSFTVEVGGRYVNAPVPPHALYYTMGSKGIGVVDLDGNGFTTNHPDTSKPALVTSLRFYKKDGNNGQNNGNNYAYGAKANPGGSIGLGSETSVPGINEGSDGIDSVVKDSRGRANLFPDPDGDEKFFNITDIDVGDFLDTIFFDKGNNWVKDTYHFSFLVTSFQGVQNNIIDTPPTPNPPPLTLPIGMRAVDIIIDDTGLLDEGVFVIMGKEVFSVPVNDFWPQPWPYDTSFVHLKHAQLCEPYTGYDQPFPPNPFILLGQLVDFVNTGPLAESSTMGTGYFYGARQQIGNFLFAADKPNNQIKVLNSNTMELITSISGFNNPDAVTVSTDLTKIYVSNSGSGYVSVFDVDPRSSSFLGHIADIKVGVQPKGICVQPEMEEVLVCNFNDNSLSLINPNTNTVRKTVSSILNKPWDVVAGPRQNGFGFGTGVYHAYITNFGGNNVVVFESGPAGVGGIGYDDILDTVPEASASGKIWMPIEDPRGLVWDPHFVDPNYLNGGCFVAHQSGSKPAVSRIQFTKQQGPWGPIFIDNSANWVGGTPGFGKRVFEIVAQWGGSGNPLSPTTGAATDVALLDYNRDLWLNNNWTGNPYVTNYGILDNNPVGGLPMNHKHPARILNIWGITQHYPTVMSDRLYVSFQFSPVIDVINVDDGAVVKTITGLAAPAKVMKTYFKF